MTDDATTSVPHASHHPSAHADPRSSAARGPWRARGHAFMRAAVGVLLGSTAFHWAAQHWFTTTPRPETLRWVDSLALATAVLALAWTAGAGWRIGMRGLSHDHEPRSHR